MPQDRIAWFACEETLQRFKNILPLECCKGSAHRYITTLVYIFTHGKEPAFDNPLYWKGIQQKSCEGWSYEKGVVWI